MVDSLNFVDSDTILVSASDQDKTVRTWNVETGAAIVVLPFSGVRSLVGSTDHPFVAIIRSQDDANVVVCDAGQGNHAQLPTSATAASFRPDDDSLLINTGEAIQGLQIYDIRCLVELWRPRSGDKTRRVLSKQGLLRTGFNSLRKASFLTHPWRLSLTCWPCDPRYLLTSWRYHRMECWRCQDPFGVATYFYGTSISRTMAPL